jgi:hypothetical protein
VSNWLDLFLTLKKEVTFFWTSSWFSMGYAAIYPRIYNFPVSCIHVFIYFPLIAVVFQLFLVKSCFVISFPPLLFRFLPGFSEVWCNSKILSETVYQHVTNWCFFFFKKVIVNIIIITWLLLFCFRIAKKMSQRWLTATEIATSVMMDNVLVSISS